MKERQRARRRRSLQARFARVLQLAMQAASGEPLKAAGRVLALEKRKAAVHELVRKKLFEYKPSFTATGGVDVREGDASALVVWAPGDPVLGRRVVFMNRKGASARRRLGHFGSGPCALWLARSFERALAPFHKVARRKLSKFLVGPEGRSEFLRGYHLWLTSKTFRQQRASRTTRYSKALKRVRRDQKAERLAEGQG